MNRQAYLEQARENLAKATVALEDGDLEAAKSFRESAENAQRIAAEFAALEGVADAFKVSAPERPQLPGTGNKSFTPAPTKGGDAPQTAPITPMELSRAAYTLRFQEPSKAVDQILRDLHGPDYEQKYWGQKAYFQEYLRRGEKNLDAEGYGLLKEIIVTPGVIQDSMGRGIDSVKSMKATLIEAVGNLGGFLVPVDFQARIIEKLQGFTVVRPKAQVDSTSRDMVEIPTSTGGDDQYSSAVRVTWVDETPVAGVAATNPTFGMESIPIHTVMAETALSRNLIEDSAFDIEAWLVRKFAEASAIDEDNKFLLGVGAKTPQGWLPGGTNALGLTEAISGSNSAILWDGLISLLFKIPSQYRANAVWIAERNTYAEIMKLKDSTSGEYYWRPFQFVGGEAGQPLRLLGYPILEQEIMPSIAQNAYPMLFGDLAGYQIFDRIGMSVERYLDSSTARTNSIMYVMRRRLGGQPVENWRMAALKISNA